MPKWEGITFANLSLLVWWLIVLSFCQWGVPWLIDFKARYVSDSIERKNKAFEKCVYACTYVSVGILDASNSIHSMDPKVYEDDKNVFEQSCNERCQ